ncbi:MAG TPA: FecR family protein, partial [Terriglobia bacterium]|nr:FecR family protein [Terriglobia bacterium]
MKFKDRDVERILDQAIAEIRDEELDPAQIDNAATRVWREVAKELSAGSEVSAGSVFETNLVSKPSLHGCRDFQALFPEYLRIRKESTNVESAKGQLTPEHDKQDSWYVLLEDHLRSCLTCRKAFEAARFGRSTNQAPPKRERQRISAGYEPRWVWAAAAALLIGVGIAWWMGLSDRLVNRGPVGKVEAIEGILYQVSRGGVNPLLQQAVLHGDEVIRTTNASGAMIRLVDGSSIELGSRSELSLSRSWRGTTIHLDRGSVIIQAAKQRLGRLQVSTPDCLVSVRGTVFAVNQGLKGARVSVVEGEVKVDQEGKQTTLLHPGQQLTTSSSLGSTPVESEIAWSRNVLRYSALLRELKVVKGQLEKAGLVPGLRYSSRLLPLLPVDTVIVAAIPNFSKTLSEGHRLLEERIQQNEALRQWQEELNAASRGEPNLAAIIEKVRNFGEYLGDELVLAVPKDKAGRYSGFMLLTEVTRSSGFPAFLHAEVEKLNANAKAKPALQIIESPESIIQNATKESPTPVFLYYKDGLLAASSSVAELQRLSAALNESTSQSFARTEFYGQLSECYQGGVGWLFGLDMKQLVGQNGGSHSDTSQSQRKAEFLERAGILNLKHLIVEHKESQGKTENSASLSFDKPRRGLTSWLGSPGPMGSLNFVSPEAHLVSAFVVKNPALLLDDLFDLLGQQNGAFQQHLDSFQSEHGINIREDLAAPLGGEFAFALDGPVLPKPSWKVIVEVNDPARLQKAVELAVEGFKRETASAGKPPMKLEQVRANGLTYYRLSLDQPGVEADYFYIDGYLVAAASRVLLDQAIQFRTTGYVLPRSETFTKLLPQDGRSNFSALIYQNLAPLLKPMVDVVGTATS